MDFSLTDEQTAFADLARTVLTRGSTQERLDEVEANGAGFDAALWRELAQAGAVGVSLPESVGGGGASFVETCLLLEQVGATAALVPVWEAVVLAALPIARFGSAAQLEALLPGVANGETVLTGAFVEALAEPQAPATTATPEGDGWLLQGGKTCVPLAAAAARILVSAATPSGVGVFLLDPTAAGVRLEPQVATNGQPQAHLVLDGATAEVLGSIEQGREILDWILLHAKTGLAALTAGATGATLRMTAEYAKGRQQFERPIATFQAVGHRLADAYADAEAVRLTMLQAAWRLVEGLPAGDAVDVAKWWAAEAGHRVLRAAHHVHGGMGVSLEYPLHRYTKNVTVAEYALGGADHQARLIGARLAAEPV
ncbi:MAG TPA: acyl-CoA dehydrogenase family protein [Mycobacteriales bacterium]|nr:acyl-CoA dehydrogenase family protein [Mycobacteriales bacterium]